MRLSEITERVLLYLHEGPLEIGGAHFAPFAAEVFSAALIGAGHEARITHDVLHRREAFDVDRFVQDAQGEDFSTRDEVERGWRYCEGNEMKWSGNPGTVRRRR